MLNRRHLRVKVLQSLYAFFQSHNTDITAGENELLHGIGKIHDMYIYQLSLLAELLAQEEKVINDNMTKRLPSQEDLHPNRRFLENACLDMIAGSTELRKIADERHIHWRDEAEMVRKLLQTIKKQPYYKDYMAQEASGFHEDSRFVLKMIKKNILPFEALHHFYEEKSIYWIDDWELVNKMLVKTLKLAEEQQQTLQIMPLFKDSSDREFSIELFRRSILNHSEYNAIISEKAMNWDVERIAMMDMIIMEMALTEILKFPEIPVKVSLNEYIELSKMYSTPKSKVFVNGVLDKLVEEFARDRLI